MRGASIGGASEGLARLRPHEGRESVAPQGPRLQREAVLGWGPVAEGDGAGSLQRPREGTASWPIGGASEGLARLRPHEGRESVAPQGPRLQRALVLEVVDEVVDCLDEGLDCLLLAEVFDSEHFPELIVELVGPERET